MPSHHNILPAEEFVRRWLNFKKSYLSELKNRRSVSATAQKINMLELTDKQRRLFDSALESALDDIMYSLLLGLDGEAEIGGIQESFTILNENGETVSPCGELSDAADMLIRQTEN